MRLLITGANGFLGKHVVKLLSKKLKTTDTLLTPSSAELNLNDHSSTMAYFERWRPDTILHLAALCGGIGFNKKYPADVLRVNLSMAINLFNAIYKYKPQYVYTAGSVCSYPRDCPVPFKENDFWNGFPEETNAGYGFSKRALLMLQQEYRKQYNIKGAHFVIVNMYGNGDDFSLNNSHVVAAFINKFTKAAKNNDTIVNCWGTGEATREFFYVEDCASALVKAVTEKVDYNQPINLGSGESISIKNLALMVSEICNFKGDIVFTGEVSDGQPKRQLDVSRAKKVLDFEAKTPLSVGIKSTIDWYENNKGK